MALIDNVCTIVPYFTVQDDKLDEFKALGEQMVERTQSESEVVYYGFSFNAQRAFCREGYSSAKGVLAHLENVDSLLKQVLAIASLDTLAWLFTNDRLIGHVALSIAVEASHT